MSELTTDLVLYNRTAHDAAAAVIARYSTSFALATRLLGPRVRGRVRDIYALVRVADEIVDGPATDAGLSLPQQHAVLDELERETQRATAEGFSANLVVHAFALTARECGIGDELTGPFFASMRTDLERAHHDERSHDDYVYGSAEVVGLMCLQAFVNAGAVTPRPAPEELVHAARRLGAAFQDVNFLRDAAADRDRLGRDYLGEVDAARRAEVLDSIDADLAAAAAAVPLLPADCRRAVTAAHDLFADLAARLRRTTTTERVRVPDARKALLATRAYLGLPPRASAS